MRDYQQQFIEFAITNQVLRFGNFTLKSGRQSPYFFNAGLFNTGQILAQLGRFYAAAIVDSGLQFDRLFGPAYKGIPLVTTTAIALADRHQRDVPYCFNRKEIIMVNGIVNETLATTTVAYTQRRTRIIVVRMI